MTKVFRITVRFCSDTLKVVNAIEGIDDCDIISINNLENNHWEIWARFHQKYSYGMEYVNTEIEECLKLTDVD